MNARFGRLHSLGLAAAVFAATLMGGAQSASADAVSDVRASLLKFEEKLRWTMESGTTVVGDGFRDRRDGWRRDVGTANPAQLGALLRELENVMTWESVDGSFAGIRDAWVASLTGAPSIAQVATGLLVLEIKTKWESMYPDWRQLRDPWRNVLHRAGGRDNL